MSSTRMSNEQAGRIQSAGMVDMKLAWGEQGDLLAALNNAEVESAFDSRAVGHSETIIWPLAPVFGNAVPKRRSKNSS